MGFYYSFNSLLQLRLEVLRATLFKCGFCVLWLTAFSVFSVTAQAESALEDDLFGSSVEVELEPPQENFSSESSFDETSLFGGGSSEGGVNEDDMFSDSSSGGEDSFKDLMLDKLEAKDTQFDIGGSYSHSLGMSSADSQKIRDSGLNSNGIVDLYFDAALDDDIRFFMKQKIRNDFTEGGGNAPALNFAGPQASTSIDQLWLKFNYHNRLYVTLGKQPTSWGAGFVWSPTDFVNSQSASPFALSDQRLGVSLIKFQFPLDKQGINLYSVFETSNANTVGEVKSLLRAEFLGKQSEFALSVASTPRSDLQLGADLSMGVGIVDAFINVAVTHEDKGTYYIPPDNTQLSADDYINIVQSSLNGATPTLPAGSQLETIDRSKEAIKEVSTGFIYIKSLQDKSQIVINGEFFYNEKGYDQSDFLTLYLLQNNFSFDPLYFSKRYSAVGITRSGFGNLSHRAGVQYIKNLSDSTGGFVMTYGFKPFGDLNFSSNCIVFTGHDGTFRPFVNDGPELQEAIRRINAGELVIPANVQSQLPAGLQAGANAQTVVAPNINVPRYIMSMQLSLSF